MSSLTEEGLNILRSNSVAGEKLPDTWLDNPNIHRLLIHIHLPTTALLKGIYVSDHGRNFYN